jgi:IS30 family transposase
VSIDERPAVINERKRLGEAKAYPVGWEVDTLIGRGRQHALVTLTERKSRLALIGKVEQRTAQAVLEIIVTLLRQRKVDSLTSDNGKEFAQHERIAEQLGLAYYFAHPNAAWERGSNENMNGLLRQYFPKTRDFTTIQDDEIELVMHRINSRPRKCLDFRTPFEVYTEPFVALKT